MQVVPVNHGVGVVWSVVDDNGAPYQIESGGKLWDKFATQAYANQVAREAEDFARFTAVRDWISGTGCHSSCSRTLAFNVVESERGRKVDPIPECGGLPCGECLPCQEVVRQSIMTCAATETCYERVKRLWKQAPIGKLPKIAETPKKEAA
jgi:hypothetical protein